MTVALSLIFSMDLIEQTFDLFQGLLSVHWRNEVCYFAT